jgi:phage gpG-like protein
MPGAIPVEKLADFVSGTIERLEDAPMPMGDLVDLAQQSVIKNFEGSESPDGRPWPPRKIKGDGHPLLIDTGTLFGAATGLGFGGIVEVGRREAEIGVSGAAVPYAAIHNNGGETRPMPQREYMGMREEDIEQGQELLADFCLRFFDR